MKPEILSRIVTFGEGLPYALLTSSDRQGVPHLAVASRVRLEGANHLVLTEYYCPRTVKNLLENRAVSVVLWDPQTDVGYQLSGVVEVVRDRAAVNGFDTGLLETPLLPQMERDVVVHVDSAMRFCRAAHLDEEVSEGEHGPGNGMAVRLH